MSWRSTQDTSRPGDRIAGRGGAGNLGLHLVLVGKHEHVRCRSRATSEPPPTTPSARAMDAGTTGAKAARERQSEHRLPPLYIASTPVAARQMRRCYRTNFTHVLRALYLVPCSVARPVDRKSSQVFVSYLYAEETLPTGFSAARATLCCLSCFMRAVVRVSHLRMSTFSATCCNTSWLKSAAPPANPKLR